MFASVKISFAVCRVGALPIHLGPAVYILCVMLKK